MVKKRKTKKGTPDVARIIRVNIKDNVYTYVNTTHTEKETKNNADCTD